MPSAQAAWLCGIEGDPGTELVTGLWFVIAGPAPALPEQDLLSRQQPWAEGTRIAPFPSGETDPEGRAPGARVDQRVGLQTQAVPLQSLNLESPLGLWVFSTSLPDSLL